MVIVVLAVYQASAGRADEVASELAAYAPIVRTEPGCVTFEVSRGIDDDHEFLLYEVYRDQAALDAHRAADHFTSIAVDRIRPMLAARRATLFAPL